MTKLSLSGYTGGATCFISRWHLEQESFQGKNDSSAVSAQGLSRWVQSPIRLLGAIGILHRVIRRMCEWHPRYSSNADWSLNCISVNGCYLQRTIYNPYPNVFYLDHWKIMKERSEVKYNSKYVTHMSFLSQTAWAFPHKMTVVSANYKFLKIKKSGTQKVENQNTCLASYLKITLCRIPVFLLGP